MIIETLRERSFNATRSGWIDEWEEDPETLDRERFLSLVESIGKGRFAQRLASRLDDEEAPACIRDAIGFVVARV